MDYLGEPRFRVAEIEGYGLAAKGNREPTVGFQIIDRAYCCCEVWGDYAKEHGGGPLWARRMRAHEKCAELNAR